MIEKIRDAFARAPTLLLPRWPARQVFDRGLRIRACSPAQASCDSPCAPRRIVGHRAARAASDWPAPPQAHSPCTQPAGTSRALACARVANWFLVEHAADRRQQVQVMPPARSVRSAQRWLPMPRAGVLMMRSRLIESCGASRQLQIGDDVFDLGALVEAESAHYDVFAPVAPQGFFDLPRLKIRCDRAPPRARPGSGPAAARWYRDEQSLVLGGRSPYKSPASRPRLSRSTAIYPCALCCWPRARWPHSRIFLVER